MSGELTIKRSGGWRKAAALAITAAVIVLVMLPILIIFFLAQDYILNGISISSGTKG